MVHNHDEMIELNPLVIEHHLIKTPRDAPADEFLDCVWYEMTDRIQYLPGGLMKGKVSYKGCFHDLPNGLQTHIYAPLGLDIREKWTIGGSLPGEVPEPRELGVNLPREGLYIREDGDMRCNVLMTSFVRKNLDHSHKVLVERILKKAERIEEHHEAMRSAYLPPTSPGIQPGSHLAASSFISTPSQSSFPRSITPNQYPTSHPEENQDVSLEQHPAFRKEEPSDNTRNILPPYVASTQQQQNYYANDIAKQRPLQPGAASHHAPTRSPKQFIAELPGSTYHDSRNSPLDGLNNRASVATELSGSEVARSASSPSLSVDPGNNVNEAQPGHYKYNPQDFVQGSHGGQMQPYGNR